jgi:ABC-type Fe2+-enterobactin transport system substrate-binding protein
VLVRDYKRKKADHLVTRIDPAVVSLVTELRGHERQAAEELDQMSQALNRLRAMVSLPKYSPPMPRPPTGDRGWMA